MRSVPLTLSIAWISLLALHKNISAFTVVRSRAGQSRSSTRCTDGQFGLTRRSRPHLWSLSSEKLPPNSDIETTDSGTTTADDGWGSSGTVDTSQLRSRIESAVGKVERQSQEPERDLFIPIFALVSLGGLMGAYGYEMLRLYSRGELYLPF